MIELAEVISNLRAELDLARKAGENEDLRFELGPVELEVTVALQREGGVGTKVRFWVVEMGADGKLASTATQRIKLNLNPRLTAAADSQPAMSQRAPYISGETAARER
jgi:hypothetical protein